LGLRGTRNADVDYDLTPDQWDTLKMLRVPAPKTFSVNRFVLEQLVALCLVAVRDNLPVITALGRKALIRGSARLWDVAA
jgi:hypothetical protein